MKKAIVLQHNAEMEYSREFFDLQVPKETNILLYAICLLCLVAFAAITFGRIDDVTKANGIVRTQGNVSSVRNVIAGKIEEIHYSPGQKVCKDDVLYSLDPSLYNVQQENLSMNKKHLEEQMEGNEWLIKSFEADKNLVPEKNAVARTQFESYLSEKQSLAIKTAIAEQEYNKELNEPEGLRVPYKIKLAKKEYELAKSSLEAYKKSFASSLSSSKESLELQYKALCQNITQLETQFSYLHVTAPVDGYIQELSSLNIGDYVEADKVVLNIVPNDTRNFRVEIQVPSKDIGKIAAGMKVKYRLAAFPYFEYRGAEGRITSVDPDIQMAGTGQPFYCVYADIDRVEFGNRHGDTFPIRAGIETNARIVTGTNTILHYILKKMDFMY